MTDAEFLNQVERDYDSLVRLARRLYRQDPEGVVQDVLLKLWSLRGAIRPATAGAFFYRTLRHECISRLRACGRRREHGLPAGELADPADPDLTEQSVEEATREFEAALEAARDAMTDSERRAFAAYWAADWDRLGAIDRLGLDPEAAGPYDMALYRARTKLLRHLRPHLGPVLDAHKFDGVWDMVDRAFRGAAPEVAS